MIEIVFLIALLAAFCVILMKKWKIAEYMQVHGNTFISHLFSCDFCMCWWTNVVIVIVCFAITKDAAITIVPFFATPISRILV